MDRIQKSLVIFIVTLSSSYGGFLSQPPPFPYFINPAPPVPQFFPGFGSPFLHQPFLFKTLLPQQPHFKTFFAPQPIFYQQPQFITLPAPKFISLPTQNAENSIKSEYGNEDEILSPPLGPSDYEQTGPSGSAASTQNEVKLENNNNGESEVKGKKLSDEERNVLTTFIMRHNSSQRSGYNSGSKGVTKSETRVASSESNNKRGY